MVTQEFESVCVTGGGGFPGGSDGKEPAPRVWFLGQEHPLGEGHGNPLQYSCLGNPMDKEAWQATICGITKSQTQLSDYWGGVFMLK